MSDMVRSFDVVRVRGHERSTDVDRAATEEPLEIRLHNRPFSVVMRTPGSDRELAAGFLLAEQVIRGSDDLGTIAHCTDGTTRPVMRGAGGAPEGRDSRDVGPHLEENVINVTLIDAAADALDRLLSERRQLPISASCGLCGRRTIESLIADVPPLRAAWTVSAPVLVSLPHRLRAAQTVFDETGGLHAAALFTRDGRLVEHAEDVGRHNAVDKVVGRMLLREALPLADHLLCVSGRTSFDIVQKAVLAGIPLVAAVSAPSSLAIDLAQASGVTLIGFVRGDGFNIYAHEARVL
jgi:FdhD protein